MSTIANLQPCAQTSATWEDHWCIRVDPPNGRSQHVPTNISVMVLLFIAALPLGALLVYEVLQGAQSPYDPLETEMCTKIHYNDYTTTYIIEECSNIIKVRQREANKSPFMFHSWGPANVPTWQPQEPHNNHQSGHNNCRPSSMALNGPSSSNSTIDQKVDIVRRSLHLLVVKLMLHGVADQWIGH